MNSYPYFFSTTLHFQHFCEVCKLLLETSYNTVQECYYIKRSDYVVTKNSLKPRCINASFTESQIRSKYVSLTLKSTSLHNSTLLHRPFSWLIFLELKPKLRKIVTRQKLKLGTNINSTPFRGLNANCFPQKIKSHILKYDN